MKRAALIAAAVVGWAACINFDESELKFCELNPDACADAGEADGGDELPDAGVDAGGGGGEGGGAGGGSGGGGGGAEPVDAGSCTNAVKDLNETDVDCGNLCPKCGTKKRCYANSDCGTNVCSAGYCVFLTCTNGYKDGSESDIDCGGLSCAPCTAGRICSSGLDCASGFCNASTNPKKCY